MTAVAPVVARHWRAEEAAVVCELCPHECRLTAGQVGLCGVRREAGGQLVTDVFGLLAAEGRSPIERKFLYHVRPGAMTWSFAAPGCNLRCAYCQNWLVSQAPKTAGPTGHGVAPETLVDQARAAGCDLLACTWSEATVFFEYALAVGQLARQAGLGFVWKTNGYTSPAAQDEIVPWLEAVNVDVKAFADETWRRLLGGRLAPVLEAIRRYHAAGVWVEVTTLIIPGINDGWDELSRLADWLGEQLGPETPWHLTRFHPDHELRHLPPTPVDRLLELRERMLARGLKHVYTDARPTGAGWVTACPECGLELVERANYRLVADRLREGRCSGCDRALAGRWTGQTAAAALR